MDTSRYSCLSFAFNMTFEKSISALGGLFLFAPFCQLFFWFSYRYLQFCLLQVI